MLFARRTVVSLVLVAVAPLAVAATRVAPTRPGTAAAEGTFKGAIVTDAMTGAVLVEDRADYSGPPASMTKLMTFAVLHDKLAAGTIALQAPVRIVNEDNIGGTQVFLDPRETFPVEELIYAMMIQSANDAARALARFSAGSVGSFVAEMNAKARALGMTRTTFHSPHGLPPSSRRLADTDMTTPRDYAILCRHLLLNTDVLKYSSVDKRDFAPERVKGAFKMDNHNKLLGKVAGVDGLKTGFTDAAGYCISVSALRNGRRVIVVVMGALGPKGQRDLGRSRDIKAIELIDRGFAALPPGSPAFAAGKGATTSFPVSVAPTTTAAAPAPADSPLGVAAPVPAAAKSAPPPANDSPVGIKFSLPPVKKK